MQRKIFRYIEKCLYNYPTNLIKLAGLVEELNIIRSVGDVNGQSYDITGGGRGIVTLIRSQITSRKSNKPSRE